MGLFRTSRTLYIDLSSLELRTLQMSATALALVELRGRARVGTGRGSMAGGIPFPGTVCRINWTAKITKSFPFVIVVKIQSLPGLMEESNPKNASPLKVNGGLHLKRFLSAFLPPGIRKTSAIYFNFSVFVGMLFPVQSLILCVICLVCVIFSSTPS